MAVSCERGGHERNLSILGGSNEAISDCCRVTAVHSVFCRSCVHRSTFSCRTKNRGGGERHPNKAEPYSDLAMALARRARETSDAAYYARAEEALKKALELSPQNLAVQKVGVWILLGKHEFAQARQQAEILNRRMPDDVQVYGFLTDANIELGNYADAEKAAQWM